MSVSCGRDDCQNFGSHSVKLLLRVHGSHPPAEAVLGGLRVCEDHAGWLESIGPEKGGLITDESWEMLAGQFAKVGKARPQRYLITVKCERLE